MIYHTFIHIKIHFPDLFNVGLIERGSERERYNVERKKDRERERERERVERQERGRGGEISDEKEIER